MGGEAVMVALIRRRRAAVIAVIMIGKVFGLFIIAIIWSVSAFPTDGPGAAGVFGGEVVEASSQGFYGFSFQGLGEVHSYFVGQGQGSRVSYFVQVDNEGCGPCLVWLGAPGEDGFLAGWELVVGCDSFAGAFQVEFGSDRGDVVLTFDVNGPGLVCVFGGEEVFSAVQGLEGGTGDALGGVKGNGVDDGVCLFDADLVEVEDEGGSADGSRVGGPVEDGFLAGGPLEVVGDGFAGAFDVGEGDGVYVHGFGGGWWCGGVGGRWGGGGRGCGSVGDGGRGRGIGVGGFCFSTGQGDQYQGDDGKGNVDSTFGHWFCLLWWCIRSVVRGGPGPG